jgi:hypothetical protein
VLATRTLNTVRKIQLPGSWAFDAISPDASRLYLIEYLSVGQTPHYRVRQLDLSTGHLDPKAVVDRREREVEMRGQPVTRKTSPDGRWAYTLYARPSQPPFIHALDTTGGKAYCIDLPLRLQQLEQMSLRLRVNAAGKLAVGNGQHAVAVVNTHTLSALKD